MNYTFKDINGAEQTVDIPAEYVKKQQQSLGIGMLEACKLYLSDEGYISDDTVQSLSRKAGKGTTGRKRKLDPVKAALVNHLYAFLNDDDYWNGTNYSPQNIVTVTAGRQITFTLGEDTYDLTLSKRRKK